MAELKTKVTTHSVTQYLNSIEPEQKKVEAFQLLKMMEVIAGEKAKLWGNNMIGFGQYHYKSERSSQEGDWPLIGFSPRKQNLTLYLMPGFKDVQDLLSKLGKHKTSVSCLYLKTLADADLTVLSALIKKSYDQMKTTHQES